MSLFEHKHKFYQRKNGPLKSSILTGVPVGTYWVDYCRCGEEINRGLTPSAEQQISWGADPASIWDDDSPIVARKGMEEQVEAQSKDFAEGGPTKRLLESYVHGGFKASMSFGPQFFEPILTSWNESHPDDPIVKDTSE